MFPVQPVAVADPGGGAQLVLLFRAAQPFLRGVQCRGGFPRLRVLPFQLLGLAGELFGGGVAGFRARGGQRLPCGGEPPLGAGAVVVRLLVAGEGAFLRLAVDVAVDLAGGGGVFGGAADRAGLAVGEAGGEFGGDAVEALFLEVEPVLLRRERLFPGNAGLFAGRPGVLGEPVAQPRGIQPPAGGLPLLAELFGPAGGPLGGLDAGLQSRAGLLPVREPGLRVLEHLPVGAFLPVQAGPLVEEFRQPPLGAAGGLQPAQFPGGPAGGGGEPGGSGVREGRREEGTRARLRAGRAPVLGLGGVPQLKGGGDGLGLAGALHPGLRLAVGAGPLLEPCRPLPRLGEAPLQPVPFAYAVQDAVGFGEGGLGGGEAAAGGREPFPRGAAGDGGGAQHRLGQPRFAGRQLGQLHGVARGLLHPVGVGEEVRVAVPYPGLGGPPALGEALLHVGEAAGVEEAAQQLAAGLGVGAQEAREVALGQQHDLAELLPAHAEELGDLLGRLLVRAAEVLPGARGRVAFAQPGLRLVQGGAGAAFLRALPGRLPGDLQAASGDGQFEGDLGADARRGVVAAQGHALAALPGAGYRAVQRVADGVQYGGLAGAGGAVQQEESGGGQLAEVDALGAAERPEGGQVQPVQPHRATSRAASSARAPSRASRRTARSCASGPAPRTWVTKSSAICWSSRPARRLA